MQGHSEIQAQLILKLIHSQVVVARIFNPRDRDRHISKFEANLVYRASFKTARATQRNPVSKDQKPKEKSSDFPFFFFFFSVRLSCAATASVCSTGDRTQNLMHVRQSLC